MLDRVGVDEDVWVPVGLAGDFAPQSAHPVVVDGVELVVWRAEADGPVRVWEDRCPHRGMRLSQGFVRDGMLSCLYHGWSYDGEGRCRRIPAHPALEPPKTICARTYAAFCRRGVVYASLTAAAGSEPSGAESWHPVRTVFVERPVADVTALLARPDNPFGAAASAVGLDGFEIRTGDAPAVFCALQAVASDRTALHLACESPDAGLRLSLARKAVRLRDELETAKAGRS